MVTVCQCNIHDSGKWTEMDQRVVTYDTAGRFARFVASANPPGSPHPPIALIGMQELMSEDDRATINAYLEEATQANWISVRTPQGINNTSGIGMFWRPELVEFRPEGYLGATVLDQLDNCYVIKFVGRLFTEVDTGESFGFVTGKLIWDSAVLNGRRVTQEDRRREAAQLKSWIAEGDTESPGMSAYSDTATVIAMDMNSGVGTPSWQEMNMDYTDPSREHTFNALTGGTLMNRVGKRLDYIWLSRDISGLRGWEFVDGPKRSPRFGSDHRAVYATVALGMS